MVIGMVVLFVCFYFNQIIMEKMNTSQNRIGKMSFYDHLRFVSYIVSKAGVFQKLFCVGVVYVPMFCCTQCQLD